MRKDDKFSKSDYLLGNIDPGLDPYDPHNPDYLYRSTYSPAPVQLDKPKKTEPIKKPQRPLPKPMVKKPTVAKVAPKVEQPPRRVKQSYYSVVERARALDRKIKASKQPSYEDLKAFHDISKEMEEAL